MGKHFNERQCAGETRGASLFVICSTFSDCDGCAHAPYGSPLMVTAEIRGNCMQRKSGGGNLNG